MVVGDVDRAAPGVLDPDVGEGGEPASKAVGGATGRARVAGERRPDPAAPARPAAAAAERDPAIGRRAPVVEREARVGDPLSAGPADLREPVRDRLGDDDVARPGQEAPGDGRPAGGPGVGRDDDLLGDEHARARRGPGRAGLDAPAAARRRARVGPVDDPRPLVDRDPLLQRDAPQPAGEPRRLDGPGVRHPRPAAEDRGAGVPATSSRVSARQRSASPAAAQASTASSQASSWAGAALTWRKPARPPLGVDRVRLAPRPQRGDRVVDRPRGPDGLRHAGEVDQPGQLVPPARDEAAVPARRAAAAEVLLDDAIRASGRSSRRRSAVHSPVYPPPMIATSAVARPANGGAATSAASSAGSAASASRSQNERRPPGRTPSSGSSPGRRASPRRRGGSATTAATSRRRRGQPVERPGPRRRADSRRSIGRRRSGGSRPRAPRRRRRPTRGVGAAPSRTRSVARARIGGRRRNPGRAGRRARPSGWQGPRPVLAPGQSDDDLADRLRPARPDLPEARLAAARSGKRTRRIGSSGARAVFR